MNKPTLTVTVGLDEKTIMDSIVHSDHKTALSFILAIDLAIADAGFTEALIKRLTNSLRGDLDAKDFADLIAELAKGESA